MSSSSPVLNGFRPDKGVSFIRQADDASLTIFRRFDEALFIVFASYRSPRGGSLLEDVRR
jgi:hypothetical protein